MKRQKYEMPTPGGHGGSVFRLLICGGLLLVMAIMFAVRAEATERKTLRYGGGGQGTVVFDGPLHASKGFVCNDCHLNLFAVEQQARISYQDHFSGKSCFACHNQVNVDRNCGFCHRKFNPAPLSTTFAMADSPQGAMPPPVPAKKNHAGFAITPHI